MLIARASLLKNPFLLCSMLLEFVYMAAPNKSPDLGNSCSLMYFD